MSELPISFRALLLFSSTGQIIFTRRYKSVEERVIDDPLPSNQELSQLFKSKVLKYFQTGVKKYSFKMSESIYFVIFPTQSLYLCIIPLIISRDPNHNEISASYSFLSFFEECARSTLNLINDNSPPSQFAPLHQIVSLVLPFGSPAIHDSYLVSQLTSPGDPKRFTAGYSSVENALIPSWKETLLFSHQKLDIHLHETVIASFDGTNSSFSVYGEIICNSELSFLPDITIDLPFLNQIQEPLSHFCLKTYSPPLIKFSPPNGSVQLLTWRQKIEKPPISGTFEYTLNDHDFEFCLTVAPNSPVTSYTVQIPLQGTITESKLEPDSGTIKDGTITWNLESPAKLTGKLTLDNWSVNKRIGAIFRFRSQNQSLTGNVISKSNVKISGSSIEEDSIHITMDYSAEPGKYIIWGTNK